jgi:hypothetical protein
MFGITHGSGLTFGTCRLSCAVRHDLTITAYVGDMDMLPRDGAWSLEMLRIGTSMAVRQLSRTYVIGNKQEFKAWEDDNLTSL